MPIAALSAETPAESGATGATGATGAAGVAGATGAGLGAAEGVVRAEARVCSLKSSETRESVWS